MFKWFFFNFVNKWIGQGVLKLECDMWNGWTDSQTLVYHNTSRLKKWMVFIHLSLKFRHFNNVFNIFMFSTESIRLSVSILILKVLSILDWGYVLIKERISSGKSFLYISFHLYMLLLCLWWWHNSNYLHRYTIKGAAVGEIELSKDYQFQ
jgi:hypothetical protein